jgi:hypothetical protein
VLEPRGKDPLEHLVLPGRLGMGPQVVAESQRAQVFFPALLDDMEVMRMRASLPEGEPLCIPQNGKKRIAQTPKPLDIEIGWSQVCYRDEDVNDRLGREAWHGCASDMLDPLSQTSQLLCDARLLFLVEEGPTRIILDNLDSHNRIVHLTGVASILLKGCQETVAEQGKRDKGGEAFSGFSQVKYKQAEQKGNV